METGLKKKMQFLPILPNKRKKIVLRIEKGEESGNGRRPITKSYPFRAKHQEPPIANNDEAVRKTVEKWRRRRELKSSINLKWSNCFEPNLQPTEGRHSGG